MRQVRGSQEPADAAAVTIKRLEEALFAQLQQGHRLQAAMADATRQAEALQRELFAEREKARALLRSAALCCALLRSCAVCLRYVLALCACAVC